MKATVTSNNGSLELVEVNPYNPNVKNDEKQGYTIIKSI